GGAVAGDRRHAAGGLLHEEAGVDPGPAGAAVLLRDRQAEPAELGHLAVEAVVVELGPALGELLALLGGAALALAEIADRGDEVALLVGQLEVHGGRERNETGRLASTSPSSVDSVRPAGRDSWRASQPRPRCRGS